MSSTLTCKLLIDKKARVKIEGWNQTKGQGKEKDEKFVDRIPVVRTAELCLESCIGGTLRRQQEMNYF